MSSAFDNAVTEVTGGPEAVSKIAEVQTRPTKVEEEDDDEYDVVADPKAPVPTDAAPAWAKVPSDFALPVGKQIFFVKFKAEWTDYPSKGDRYAIMWNLSDADEKLALKRTRGDSARMLAELTKQMIRVVDGERVDWSRGAHANIERWWDDIGGKCRQLVQSAYHKSHHLNDTEQADFFLNCFAVKTAVAG